MRLGTREAIHYVVEHLDENVRTSGAVHFDRRVMRPGLSRIVVFSYAMRILEIVVQTGKTTPEYIVRYDEKRSVTTSKHQTWTFGAVNRYWPTVTVIDGADEAANQVAADKAAAYGWGGIDAATLEQRENYSEREYARRHEEAAEREAMAASRDAALLEAAHERRVEMLKADDE